MERDTVFVRGLAPGINHDELNDAFAEVGPVKSAFVVVEKDGPKKGQSRGFGFVQFALAEDAVEAVRKLNGKALGPSAMVLELAERKGFKRDPNAPRQPAPRGPPQQRGQAQAQTQEQRLQQQQQQQQGRGLIKALAQDAVVTKRPSARHAAPAAAPAAADDDVSADEADDDDADADADADASAPAAGSDAAARRKTEALLRDATVVFYRLPEGMTEAQLRKKAGKVGKVNVASMPFEGVPRSGLVVFTKRTSAAKALSKLNSKLWTAEVPGAGAKNKAKAKKSKKEDDTEEEAPAAAPAASSIVLCRSLNSLPSNAKSKSRCRLIVRNLAWSTGEEALRAAFEVHGPVLQVKMGGDDAKAKGFAFVQFACRPDAEAALKALNGSSLAKRPIAVDWALSKADYEKLKQQEQNLQQPKVEMAEAAKTGEAGDADPRPDEGENEDEDEEEGHADEDEAVEEEEDGDDVEEEEEGESESESETKTTKKPDGPDATRGKAGSAKDAKDKAPEPGTGEELGLTLFLRNVLFETTENEIFDCFSKYGGVRYVKVAKGPDGRSRGVAFVSFYRRTGVTKALEAAATVPAGSSLVSRQTEQQAPGGGGCGISLAGRPLLVTLAVDRAKAGELATPDADKKVKSDRRHLYLAREGLLHAESEVGVPPGDLAKRERADADKKTKLKNPLFFVSPVRLSVRNLFRGDPGSGEPEVKEGDLKKHFLAAAIRGLREGLVDRVDGDQSLFPAGWPDRKNMASPAIKTVRIMREDSAPVVVAEERERAEGEASEDEEEEEEERDEGDSDDSDGGEARNTRTSRYARKKNKRLKIAARMAKGRSRGYAFIEFGEHVHALAALRLLNNNPEFAFMAPGGPRAMKVPAAQRARLIIEFAVENAAKLRLQQLAAERREMATRDNKARREQPDEEEEEEEEQQQQQQQQQQQRQQQQQQQHQERQQRQQRPPLKRRHQQEGAPAQRHDAGASRHDAKDGGANKRPRPDGAKAGQREGGRDTKARRDDKPQNGGAGNNSKNRDNGNSSASASTADINKKRARETRAQQPDGTSKPQRAEEAKAAKPAKPAGEEYRNMVELYKKSLLAPAPAATTKRWFDE